MISRKDWNNLPALTRLKAAKLVFYNMGDEFQNNMAEEWHHNNDKFHEVLFQSIYWNKDKRSIRVIANVNAL